MSGGEKKSGFWQRLFGGGPADSSAQPPAQKDPPSDSPAKKDPPAPKPGQKEPPEHKRPPKKAATASAPKAPPPAGPKEVPGEPPPEERSPAKREKGPDTPGDGPNAPKPEGEPAKRKQKTPEGEGDAPPPAGPTAPTPEEKPAGTREKGTPEKAPVAPAENRARNDEAPGSAPRLVARRGWFSELREGLSRSSAALGDNLASVFTRRKLDEDTLDEIEAALIKSDLGVGMAARIRGKLAGGRFERGISPGELREVLATEIASVLQPVAKPLAIPKASAPQVILLVGVNGTGKTTTAAKLAHLLIKDGKTVLLAAADTFRAAAIDQLKVWGGRVGAEVVTKDVGADPAGIAYEALERAKAEGRDVLIIDTAGRLQNKSDLMAELAKIVRVLKKLDADAPHGVLLVLDATTGQNALSQVEIFREIAGVTGIVLTKLDGSARGGILVAIAERFSIPVNAIGIGEGIEDLRPFDAQDFARAIAGLDVKNAKAA